MQNKTWFHVWADDPQVKAWGFCADEGLQFILDAPKEQSWIIGKQYAIAKQMLIDKGYHGVKVATIKYNL